MEFVFVVPLMTRSVNEYPGECRARVIDAPDLRPSALGVARLSGWRRRCLPVAGRA